MAIERMKKVTLVALSEDSARLADWLYWKRVMHVAEVAPHLEELPVELSRLHADSRHAEGVIVKLERIISISSLVETRKEPFLESLFTPKKLIEERKLQRLLSEVDVEHLFNREGALRAELTSVEGKIEYLKERLRELEGLSFLKVPPADLAACRNIHAGIFTAPTAALVLLEERKVGLPHFAFQVIREDREQVLIALAWLPDEREAVLEFADSLNMKRLALPEISRPVEEEIGILRAELESLKKQKGLIRSKVESFSRHVDVCRVLLAFWKSERLKALNVQRFLTSERLCVVKGFVRRADVGKFQRDFSQAFPEAAFITEDPAPRDDVPVSLRHGSFFRPAALLVNMFGLPPYFSFDPTPYIALTFLLFFGICFSDVLYGAMMVAAALYLMRRFRTQESLCNFFRLFLYAGVSTIICGALLGSWASDLYEPKYLGEGNILLRVRNALLLLDPLAAPVVGLVAAIAIGILNQLYGIVLKMVENFRRHDFQAAVFDGVFWLVYLPGVVIIVASIFVAIPKGVLWTVAGITGCAMVGLVLTQGRDQNSWPVRLVVGMVSLYGIVGAYGTTSFIADVLSYSRLLALGLTTTIVGMSFNILAGVVKPAPFVGIAFFALILLVGHVFNFLMSMVSAFVHSARLILLEFFTRFYSGGGIRFVPFGFTSDEVELSG